MSYFNGEIHHLGQIPSPLFDALAEAASTRAWDDIRDKVIEYPVFRGTTSHRVLLFPATGERDHRTVRAYNGWPEWRKIIEPIMAWSAERMGIAEWRPCRCMLARLHAGKIIGLHTDFIAPSAQVPHKIHVPIFTDERVVFNTVGSEHHLREGLVYEVNNGILHGGRNRSDMDRVHLIFEIWDYDTENVAPIQFDTTFCIERRDASEASVRDSSGVEADANLPAYDFDVIAQWLRESGPDLTTSRRRRPFHFTLDTFVELLRGARTRNQGLDPRLDIVSALEILKGLLRRQIVVPSAWKSTHVSHDPFHVILS